MVNGLSKLIHGNHSKNVLKPTMHMLCSMYTADCCVDFERDLCVFAEIMCSYVL